MKANEYRSPKRTTTKFVAKDDAPTRYGSDYGIAILKGEFSGFGKNALGKLYEEVESVEDDKNDETENEERD